MNSSNFDNSVFFVATLFLFALTLPEARSASAIDQADQKVVRVIDAFERDGDVYLRSHGSGVVIDSEGTVLTNAHVLEGAQQILVQWKDGGGRVGYEDAVVLAIDKEQDLGLIRVRNMRVTPMAFDLTSVRKGVPVYAIGFPGLADGDTSEAIRNSFVEATVTSGIVSRLVEPFVQHSAIISGGNSGGALVNGCGNLVGINTAVNQQISERGDKVEAAGFGYAINTTLAYGFAKKNGVNPVKSEGSCKTTGPDYQESDGDLGSGKGIFFSALAFAAAIAALAIAAVVYRRARLVAPGTLPKSTSTFAIPEKAWVVDGRTGDGQRVHGSVVEGQHTESAPLILGRDASCGLVVSDSTVSRNHAKLFVSSGQLWCADLESINGTKVNGQVCGQAALRVPECGALTLGKTTLNVTNASRGVRT